MVNAPMIISQPKAMRKAAGHVSEFRIPNSKSAVTIKLGAMAMRSIFESARSDFL